ncbi:LysR family transcriptional regulator [Pseudomonas sp. PhalM4]
MHVTQPAVSNTLNRLRVKFNDPLFVLYGRRLEPTMKAVEIAEALTPILSDIQGLMSQAGSSGQLSSVKMVCFESSSV